MVDTPSLRMQRVQDPIIPIVAQLIRENPGTISLGQGVVHYGPPPEARQAIADFWETPANHLYQSVQGLPELRDLIAEKLKAENGIPITDDRQLFVTSGGNMAFMNALFAIASAGDEIIILSPYYFNHEMAIAMLDCKAVVVPTDGQYQLDIDRIEAAISPRTRAIVTVSPNNPTGAVYPEADLRAINALCARRGIYHINDEAYEYFTYGDSRHFSPGSLHDAGDHTISLFSLSKAYGFAGWRIGYMVAPAHLHLAIAKAQDTLLISAPTICQRAAIGALKAGRAYCAPYIAAMAGLRRDVLDAFSPLADRVRLPAPDGAFYALLHIDTRMTPLELVQRLVREHRVAVIPGTAFGMQEGCYLRVAFGALQAETITEGIGRLTRGLSALLRD
ncbi:MAG: pyridoxal phosphate-dependent aminotransferase [Rhodothermales bacterium]